MNKQKFPFLIREKSVVVKIHSTPNKGRPSFTVVYYDGGGVRNRQAFSEYADAHKAAKSVAAALAKGNMDALTLSGPQRYSFERATEALRPTGIPLDIAVIKFTEATRLLGEVGLEEAARFYVVSESKRVASALALGLVRIGGCE